jgi:hypothetical protein
MIKILCEVTYHNTLSVKYPSLTTWSEHWNLALFDSCVADGTVPCARVQGNLNLALVCRAIRLKIVQKLKIIAIFQPTWIMEANFTFLIRAPNCRSCTFTVLAPLEENKIKSYLITI